MRSSSMLLGMLLTPSKLIYQPLTEIFAETFLSRAGMSKNGGFVSGIGAVEDDADHTCGVLLTGAGISRDQ